ncbi:MAG: homocysteine biosynthesis protein, partial [Syntrophaceticus sp.]|nr:homocysteine biosynthesis protein [Syntrophaceticus sp.]
TDADIYSTIADYSTAYPQRDDGDLGRVSYAELRSGEINIQGNKVPTTPLSSYIKAREIAQILKNWITDGGFLLTEPVQPLPSTDAGISLNNLEEKKNNR